MKLWMSNETAGVSTIDTRNLRKVRNSIEEDLNNYLKSISYSNEKLTEVLLFSCLFIAIFKFVVVYS
jgi:hypothetical protein